MPNGQFQQQQMQQNVATIRNKDEKDINSKVDDLMKS